MPDRNEIAEQVCEIVADVLHLPPKVVTEEMRLRGRYVAEMDIVDIAMAVESAYDIAILVGDEDAWQSVGDVIDYVERRLNHG